MAGAAERAILLVAGAIASISAPAGAQVTSVGLGQYTLGMTIDEARQVDVVTMTQKFPSKVFDYETGFACSGDEFAPAELDQSADEQSENLVECFNARRVPGPTNKFSQDTVAFGEIYLDPVFRFRAGRLYEIELHPHTNWQLQLTDALELKYGKPTSQSVTTVSNAYGAEWPRTTSHWNRGTQEVVLEAPGALRDQMSLRYVDHAVADALEQRLRAKRAAATGI